MSEARSYDASTYDPRHGFIVSGGRDPNSASDKVEASLDGATFNSFKSLPIKVAGHCLITLNNGGDLFLAGGWDGRVHLRNTYVYRSGSIQWDSVEKMPTARDEVACGSVRGTPDGPAEEVVVAGGCTGKWFNPAIVEIFNVHLEVWRTSKNLLFGPLKYGTAVLHHNTFILVGGREAKCIGALCAINDSVLEYNAAHDNWEKLPVTLGSPRYGVTAMFVPSEKLPSCNVTTFWAFMNLGENSLDNRFSLLVPPSHSDRHSQSFFGRILPRSLQFQLNPKGELLQQLQQKYTVFTMNFPESAMYKRNDHSKWKTRGTEVDRVTLTFSILSAWPPPFSGNFITYDKHWKLSAHRQIGHWGTNILCAWVQFFEALSFCGILTILSDPRGQKQNHNTSICGLTLWTDTRSLMSGQDGARLFTL